MVSLDTRQVRSPVEDLHISQGRPTIAHRARKAEKKKSRNVWRLGTWNVTSMVDTEGPIEGASLGNEQGEDRKVDWLLGSWHNMMSWRELFRRPSGLPVGHMKWTTSWF